MFTVGALANSGLALISEALIASYFGATGQMDVFFTANLIPAIASSAIVSTLTLAFIPIFNSAKAAEGEDAAWDKASRVFGAFTVYITILYGLLVLAGPFLLGLIAPGFSPEKREICIRLFRWLCVAGLLTGINSILTGLLNASFRFALPAFLAVFQTVATIACIVSLAGPVGVGILPIAFIVGAGLQLVALLGTIKYQFPLTWKLTLWAPELSQTLVLAAWMMAANVIYSGLGIYDRWAGSYLPEGSISYLSYSSKLGMFVANVLSIGIATVSYAVLSKHAAEKEEGRFGEQTMRALNYMAILFIPAIAGLLICGDAVVMVLYQRHAFSHEATLNVWYAMCGYAGLFLAYGLGRPLGLAFYASGRKRFPTLVAVLQLAGYVALGWLFIGGLGLGFVGLCIASSIVHLGGLAIYVWQLARAYPSMRFGGWLYKAGKNLVFALAAGVACRKGVLFALGDNFQEGHAWTRSLVLLGAVAVVECLVIVTAVISDEAVRRETSGKIKSLQLVQRMRPGRTNA